MEKKIFCSLNVARPVNDDASTLFQYTILAAIPLKAGIGEMANVALTNFQTAAGPFIDQTNRLRESPLTKQLVAGRKLSDDLMSEIKRTVVFESKSRTEITKTAALDMGYFYKPYWDLSGRSMGKQITDTTDMVAKYEADATFVAKGKTIGVDTAMNELKTINTNQQALYLTRNQEVGGRAASGTDLRPGANESYTQLCNVVEQAVNLMPNESLLTLFNNMDQLRVKTHALLTKPNVETDETSIKS